MTGLSPQAQEYICSLNGYLIRNTITCLDLDRAKQEADTKMQNALKENPDSFKTDEYQEDYKKSLNLILNKVSLLQQSLHFVKYAEELIVSAKSY